MDVYEIDYADSINILLISFHLSDIWIFLGQFTALDPKIIITIIFIHIYSDCDF